jgi:hypothetical protein
MADSEKKPGAEQALHDLRKLIYDRLPAEVVVAEFGAWLRCKFAWYEETVANLWARVDMSERGTPTAESVLREKGDPRKVAREKTNGEP